MGLGEVLINIVAHRRNNCFRFRSSPSFNSVPNPHDIEKRSNHDEGDSEKSRVKFIKFPESYTGSRPLHPLQPHPYLQLNPGPILRLPLDTPLPSSTPDTGVVPLKYPPKLLSQS